MPALADLLVQAVNLLALALAPAFVSPAPGEAKGLLPGVLAALALVTLLFAAGRLRVRLGRYDGLAAALLVGAAVVAALIAADVFRGNRAPLGRGVAYVAVPLWAGLAVVAGAVAARRFGSTFPGARVLATGLVAAAFAGAVLSAWGWLFSTEQMWLAQLRRDGDDMVAVEALTRAPMRARRLDDAMAVLGRCLVESPGACACLARRTSVAFRLRALREATEELRTARAACPGSLAVRAAAAEGLALFGDAEAGEQEARAGLEKADTGPFHYALAAALDRLGRRAEALEEAKRGVALGAGRDGALLLAQLAINADALDVASDALRPVVAADPDDADALYDLALVAHKRRDYNAARQGYLAALRANPRLADARYNLVDLTLSRGAPDEARHHLQRFIEAFPGDPRGAVLATRVAAGR